MYSKISERVSFSNQKYLFQLILICVIGIVLRISLISHEVPLILDAGGYFWYAIDTSILGHLPENECEWKCKFPNTGWPAFLSLFFMIMPSENFLDYMNLQKYLTISLSVITTIPLYFLSKLFVRKEMAILACSLFIFHPRIIENSILGISEPLFILIFVLMLLVFLKYFDKFPFIAFGLIGIMSIIRYEGLLLIIPITVYYFYKARFSKTTVKLFVVSLVVFIIIVVSWGQMKVESTGQDGIFSHVSSGPVYYSKTLQNSDEPIELLGSFIQTGIQNTLRYLAISTFPTLVFLVPAGIIILIKNKNFNFLKIFLPIVFTLLIISFYAYSRGILETRYLLVIFPIFSIVGAIFLQDIFKIDNLKRNILIIFSLLLLTIGFIYFHNLDKIDEKEGYDFAKIVVSKMNTSNNFSQASHLDNIRFETLEDFPVMRKNITKDFQIIYSHKCSPKIVYDGCDRGFNNLEDFINKNRSFGLKHIVIDDGFMQHPFFNDNFEDYEKYPYLEKIYDTNEDNFKSFRGKIFLINFEKLDKFINQK